MLDQLATYSGKKIALADVLAMLGTVESELLFESVDIAAANDSRGALLFVNRLAEQGKDFGQFAQELIGHLRNIFLLQQLDDYPPGIITAAEEDLTRLKGQARLLAPSGVVRFVELLGEALSEMKRGSDPRLQLELAFIKMTRPEVDRSTKSLLYRLDQLESRLGSGGSRPRVETAGTASKQANEIPAPAGKPQPESTEPDGDAVSNSLPAGTGVPPGVEPLSAESISPVSEKLPLAPEPEAPPLELSLDKIVRVWSVILTQVKKKKIPLYSLLQEARPIELEGKVLTLGFPAGAAFHKGQVEKPNYMEVILGVLKEMTGAVLSVKCVVAEGDDARAVAAPAREERDGPSADELIEMFKAELDAEEIP